MEYRKLGRSDLRVSTVCMGCWAIVDDKLWGAQDVQDAIAAIQASYDAGVNFFDTAELYGDGSSEELLAKALEGRREKAVLASKVASQNVRAADLRKACEASLRRLKTDRIDLYQVHWPNHDVPFAETLGELQKLKAEGKIRAIGISNFQHLDLVDWLALGHADANQFCYSLLWRAIEFETLPLCVKHDVSVLCYSPMMQGLLTGKFRKAADVPDGRARTRLFSKDRPLSRHGEPGLEGPVFDAINRMRELCEAWGVEMAHAALAWLLAQPGVASVVAGARDAAQARDNAKAGDLKLSAEQVAQLGALTEPIKQHFGANADLWQSQSRMR
ncbi:MAG: aldo/keto reductase [Planctomycetota bacterium]|nr:aldo/keto reductase [Planctomycetota bacterium]